MQNLHGEDRDISGIDPALLGRGISGMSMNSNMSDLDTRAIDLLLGNQVDEDHIKVSFISLVMIKSASQTVSN